jgi:4-amino-4-deoxy-L-arabinose transferase-like glycosyltransferase
VKKTRTIKSTLAIFKLVLQCLSLLALFILNIYLINQGSGFTVPRELLFRTKAEILTPIIAFSILLFLFFLFSKKIANVLPKLSFSKKKWLILLIAILGFLVFANTPETNPDYGRYLKEAKYFATHVPIKFLSDWGTFHYRHDMPTIPAIFGLGFKFLGEKKTTVLLINLFFFLSTGHFIYLLGREFGSKSLGFLSSFFWFTTPFVLTQAPLLLVDLGQTFFTTLCFFLLFRLLRDSSFKFAVFVGIIFFLTVLTKIFAPLFLLAIMVGIPTFSFHQVLKHKKQIVIFLTTFIFLTSLYVFWKKELFVHFLARDTSLKKLTFWFLPLLIFSAAMILVSFLFKKFLKKQIFLPLALLLFYTLLLGLFIFGGKRAFFVRTLFIATNVPLTLLFYLAPAIAYLTHQTQLLVFLPWSLAPFFITNTMFKYQLPAYPAISILAAAGLLTIFKKRLQRIRSILIILAFSISITYFFFLPMIQNHIKANIKAAGEYTNRLKPEKIALVFIPEGDLGEELLSYFDESRLYQTPSLVHLIDYYTTGEITYYTPEVLIEESTEGEVFDVVLVASNAKEVKIEEKLGEILSLKYKKGPSFNKATGAGIWRVSLSAYVKRSSSVKPEGP